MEEYLKYKENEIFKEMEINDLMEEYISLEYMCLSESRFKHIFDSGMLKKVIISQELGIDIPIKSLLLDKISYLKEEIKFEKTNEIDTEIDIYPEYTKEDYRFFFEKYECESYENCDM
jgi:hypothetical protein